MKVDSIYCHGSKLLDDRNHDSDCGHNNCRIFCHRANDVLVGSITSNKVYVSSWSGNVIKILRSPVMIHLVNFFANNANSMRSSDSPFFTCKDTDIGGCELCRVIIAVLWLSSVYHITESVGSMGLITLSNRSKWSFPVRDTRFSLRYP